MDSEVVGKRRNFGDHRSLVQSCGCGFGRAGGFPGRMSRIRDHHGDRRRRLGSLRVEYVLAPGARFRRREQPSLHRPTGQPRRVDGHPELPSELPGRLGWVFRPRWRVSSARPCLTRGSTRLNDGVEAFRVIRRDARGRRAGQDRAALERKGNPGLDTPPDDDRPIQSRRSGVRPCRSTCDHGVKPQSSGNSEVPESVHELSGPHTPSPST